MCVKKHVVTHFPTDRFHTKYTRIR